MKTARLIIGIISIVLFVVISLQSCAVGVGGAIEQAENSGAGNGFFMALLMLISGIISVSTRSSRGGAITSSCFYLLAALVGFSGSSYYGDLVVWAVLSFLFFAISVLAAIFFKKPVPQHAVVQFGQHPYYQPSQHQPPYYPQQQPPPSPLQAHPYRPQTIQSPNNQQPPYSGQR